MTLFTLLLRTIRYYRKEHLLLLMGLIVSTAVLTSALIIGDSIQHSLQQIVGQRLGTTQHIIVTQERFFPAGYATKLAQQLKVETAPVLLLRGSVGAVESEQRIAAVEISGVNTYFWKIGDTEPMELLANEVVINEKAAQQLQVTSGDEVLLRIEKARFVTDNSPFVPDDENSITLRLTVKAIIGADDFGNFNIRTDQITPYNLFVNLETLSSLVLNDTYANLMLIGENKFSAEQINDSVTESWELDVMNLELDMLDEQQQWELRSASIFMEDKLLQVLRNAGLQPIPVMSYLINFIHANGQATPYSFASGMKEYPGIVLSKDELIVNQWLADDLQLQLNDTVALEYFIAGPFRKLISEKSSFVVKHIIPVQGFAADPSLMPAFEGLAGVESCSNWNAGIPMEFSKIRDKDEDWWSKHKGTPKAFISYDKAVELWSKEFGNSTSIRFDARTNPDSIRTAILQGLQPGNTGMNIVDVRNDSRWSASNAVDFAGLFLALSFFLLLASFLLSGLLFSMMITQRENEQGSYRALGIPSSTLRIIYFSEGMMNALIGSIAGVVAGIGSSYLILYFLNSIWFDIVRTSSIDVFIAPGTLVTGAISNLIVAAVVIGIVLRRQLRKQIGSMQKNTAILGEQFSASTRKRLVLSAALSGFHGLLLLGYSIASDLHQNSTLLFISGFLLLVALISLAALLIHRAGTRNVATTPIGLDTHNTETTPIGLDTRNTSTTPFGLDTRNTSTTPFGLAIRHLYFDWKRNITLITILSIGIFIVLATGAYRVDFTRDAEKSSSGTGGYDWFITTQIGLKSDLNTPEGLSKTALDDLPEGTRFVQMHRFESDDASCLNLNRVLRPSVLGLDPATFIDRQSFSFVKTMVHSFDSPWQLLQHNMGPGRIPAIADQTVITWGLGLSVGDSIAYLNERGDTLQLILVSGLANSVFQGHLLISEENFITHFPSNSGSKVMLADFPAIKENFETEASSHEEDETANASAYNDDRRVNESSSQVQDVSSSQVQDVSSSQVQEKSSSQVQEETKALLEGALRNYGVELQPASDRLAMFNSVTNTYLDIFLAMGGIALLLGTIGIAILLIRSVHSRRRIFAMMQAVGIPIRQLYQIIGIEYLIILGAGISIGVVAAAVASLSGLLAAGAGVPYVLLISIVILFKLSGIFWIYIAAKTTVKKEFIRELRNE